MVFAMAHTSERAFELISAAHNRGRLAHAFLVTGAPGSGKEKLAAKIIRLVNGASSTGFDLFGEPVVEVIPPLDELESGWVRVMRPQSKSRRLTVTEIRNLEHTLQLCAPSGACKVAVLCEADRLNDQAANAFLKTLEEPPLNTVLMLLTAHPQRLLPTIISRCVRIQLLGGRTLLAEGGDKIVTAITEAAQRNFGTPLAAMQMKAAFTTFLAAARKAADDAAKAAAKEEIATYREGTDGTWLKAREDVHKAAAEADYLDARNRMLNVLMAWMADLLRLKASGESGGTAPREGALDFPEQVAVLRPLANAESQHSLLRRMEALISLRRTLETNAFEPLAMEVGFLNAFG